MLVFQAAAATALGVYVSFEGVQVLIGVLLGFVSAWGFGAGARSVDEALPGMALLWYQAGALAGLVLNTVWRPLLVAIAAPVLGAWLLVSGALCLVLRALAADPARSVLSVGMEVVGPSSLCALCGVALVAVAVQSQWRRRDHTAAVLAGGLAVATLPGRTGLACWLSGLVFGGCPAWLEPARSWWPAVACAAWAALSVAAAWRQLGELQAWEAKHFWSHAALRYPRALEAIFGGNAPEEVEDDLDVDELLPQEEEEEEIAVAQGVYQAKTAQEVLSSVVSLFRVALSAPTGASCCRRPQITTTRNVMRGA